MSEENQKRLKKYQKIIRQEKIKRMQICRNKLILDESENKFVNDKLMINLTGLLKTKIVF